jgi:hypothetical protein
MQCHFFSQRHAITRGVLLQETKSIFVGTTRTRMVPLASRQLVNNDEDTNASSKVWWSVRAKHICHGNKGKTSLQLTITLAEN